MRIQIKANRLTFWTIFRICALCVFSYVLAIFCFVGLISMGKSVHYDPNLRAQDLVVGFVGGLTVVPFVLGFILALPSWFVFWLYGRFRKLSVTLVVDSMDAIEEIKDDAVPNQSTKPTLAEGQRG